MIIKKYARANPTNFKIPSHNTLLFNTNSVNAAEGWVKKLYVKDNSLYADFDVNDEIYNQIKEQKYKKISICIEKVGSNNYILKHIGLLGAAAPAVAGMQSIELNEQLID